jgi:hypothetical protein
MSSNDHFESLAKKNHWRFMIRPTVFDAARLPNLSACWRLIEECQVQLRGWNFPHVQGDYKLVGNDWIQSGFKTGDLEEAWRLFQSGQFVFYSVIYEDFHEVPWKSSRYPPSGKPRRYLEITSTIYKLAEFFEFAARLAAKNLLSPAVEMSVRITGLTNRPLVYWDAGRHWWDEYSASEDVLEFQRTVSDQELLGSSAEIALDAAIHFFERFQWFDAPRAQFAEDQRRLLERDPS